MHTDPVKERIKIERVARRRGINPKTLWAAVEDELGALIVPQRDPRMERENRIAWRLLGGGTEWVTKK